jgi:hypothetical protein
LDAGTLTGLLIPHEGFEPVPCIRPGTPFITTSAHASTKLVEAGRLRGDPVPDLPVGGWPTEDAALVTAARTELGVEHDGAPGAPWTALNSRQQPPPTEQVHRSGPERADYLVGDTEARQAVHTSGRNSARARQRPIATIRAELGPDDVPALGHSGDAH